MLLRPGSALLPALLSLTLLSACSNDSTAASDAGASSGGTGAADSRPTIAMIPKGTTHVFWNTVEEGARRAADELGVELIWKGPLEENDRAQQIQVVQQFTSQGVDGVVLAPLDYRALVSPVAQARSLNIPVVIFDSGLDGTPGDDYVSYVATDNFAGGRMAGEFLSEQVGAGKIVLLRYLVGSQSTDERERGFLEAIAENDQLEVLVDNRYAGPTMGDAKNAALNMLDALKEADGVFCPCEPVVVGMLLALRQEGLLDELVLVGFDASPPLVEGMASGEIDALVVQDPRKMGYLAVETMVRHLNGEEVDANVDTGAVLATPENMDEPEIRKLLE